MHIENDDAEKVPMNLGRRQIEHPDLIYVCVQLGETRSGDRSFICQKSDIQDAWILSYTWWMESKGWKRPRNYQSLDNRYHAEDVARFENNWNLIADRLIALQAAGGS